MCAAPAPSTRHLGTQHRTKHQAPGTRHPAPHQAPGTRHQARAKIALNALPPRRRAVVRRGIRRADAAAGARLAAHCARRVDARVRANGQREDAGGLSVVPRPRDVFRCAGKRLAVPCALRLADQGSGGRHRAQPAGADCRHRARCRRARGRACRADREHPHRGHAGARPREVSARAHRHPDHDTRVAVSAAHLPGAARTAKRRDGHRGRDPRAGAHQARGAPGAVARTPGTDHESAAPAHRTIGHAAAAR